MSNPPTNYQGIHVFYISLNKLIAWIWFPPNRPPTRHNKKHETKSSKDKVKTLQVFWVTTWWCSICCWKVVVCTLKGPEFNSKFETSFVAKTLQHGRRRKIRLALCFDPRLLSSMKKCQRCKWIQTSFIWMPCWMRMRHLGTLLTTCCVCLFSTVHYLGFFEGGRSVFFVFRPFE